MAEHRSVCVCRVTVSSYPEDVKVSISHLVTILGGKYTTSLGKKNSHLLIRAAAGPKFAGCMSRQVIPVVADWLIESAYAGTGPVSDASCL